MAFSIMTSMTGRRWCSLSWSGCPRPGLWVESLAWKYCKYEWFHWKVAKGDQSSSTSCSWAIAQSTYRCVSQVNSWFPSSVYLPTICQPSQIAADTDLRTGSSLWQSTRTVSPKTVTRRSQVRFYLPVASMWSLLTLQNHTVIGALLVFQVGSGKLSDTGLGSLTFCSSSLLAIICRFPQTKHLCPSHFLSQ